MPMPAVTLASTIANASACASMNCQLSEAASASAARPKSATAANAVSAIRSGPRQLCADRYNGPARMVKPPVMVMMTRMTSADVPTAVSSRPTVRIALRRGPTSRSALRRGKQPALLQDGQQQCVFLLPFDRERPLLAERLIEFGAEEIVLEAAVDDVPGEHFVRRAIAEHEEVRVDAALGHRGAPVSAVPLRHLDCRGDAPVAEREQRLVERMPLRLDVDVDVVDAGHQAPHPPDLALDRPIVFHRQPLVRGARLRHERVDAADDTADVAAGALVSQHDLAKLQRHVTDRHEVLVRLRRQPDHEVQLQV